jgi:hypothetical protein
MTGGRPRRLVMKKYYPLIRKKGFGRHTGNEAWVCVKSVPESARGCVDQSAPHIALEIQPNSMLHLVMAYEADRNEMSGDGSYRSLKFVKRASWQPVRCQPRKLTPLKPASDQFRSFEQANRPSHLHSD